MLRLPPAALGSMDSILSLRVRSGAGQLVPISEVVKVVDKPWADAIYHKDLLPYTFVTGDDAGQRGQSRLRHVPAGRQDQ